MIRITYGFKYEQRQKNRRAVEEGILKIKANRRSTFITVTDNDGKTLSTVSAGDIDVSGGKKKLPLSVKQMLSLAYEDLKKFSVKKVDIILYGLTKRIKFLVINFLPIIQKRIFIKSFTEIPIIILNGVRLKKARKLSR